jgi:hypothetical protein
MITKIYEHNGSSGKVLIDMRERGLLMWHDFICNLTFHKDGLYEERIKQMTDEYGNDENKLLVIVNDISEHPYPKRVHIKLMNI